MNQRPFISTQLNIFDENRCVFSPSMIAGQPVMISQEQNRKTCDSLTTAIASNQPRMDSCFCASPRPLAGYPNQQQVWTCPLQAQKQGVPGGVVFNFSQPNYACPPSCFPSAYNPPPPPCPQMIDCHNRTPQSICTDFGKFGMEAMMFQDKCRRQCQGFTYDKQVGTADQIMFPKCNTCCCGVQSTTLRAEQKEEMFHKIDEGDMKSNLKICKKYDPAGARKCQCFPKPNANKYGSAKNLVLGERKERSCKDYDIVDQATRQADAEAYLCCDCLDKWKKENENKRPSCLKKRYESPEEKSDLEEVTFCFCENTLEITENKKESGPKIEEISAENEPTSDIVKQINEMKKKRRDIVKMARAFRTTAKDYLQQLDNDIDQYRDKLTTKDTKSTENFIIDHNCEYLFDNNEFSTEEAEELKQPNKSLVSESDNIKEKETKNEDKKEDESRKSENEKSKTENYEEDKTEEKQRNIDHDDIVVESNKSDVDRVIMKETKDEEIMVIKESSEVIKSTEDLNGRKEVTLQQEKESSSHEENVLPVLTDDKLTSVDEGTKTETNNSELENSQQKVDEHHKENERNDGEEILHKDNEQQQEKQEENTIKNENDDKKLVEHNLETSMSTEQEQEKQKRVFNEDKKKVEYKPEVIVTPGPSSAPSEKSKEDYICIGDHSCRKIMKFIQDQTRKEVEKLRRTSSEEMDGCRCCDCDYVYGDICRKKVNSQVTENISQSRVGNFFSNVYSNIAERASNFMCYFNRLRPASSRPFYENPSILTDRHCDSNCYGRRIERYNSGLGGSSKICPCRMDTNRFCGKTSYDHDTNRWYSCCHGFSKEQKIVTITFRETAERRTIRLKNNCRNSRYHVVYE